MKISFCTTCMGGVHHLKKTLPANIRDNAGFKDLEFVILDYHSKDGLLAWAKWFLPPFIESGRVTYLHERDAKFFLMPHAKNIACCFATGDVVCNVDADNFTGPRFAQHLDDVFSKDMDSLARINERIAVSRKNFLRVRGYDEKMTGYASGGHDFVNRSLAMGLKPVGMEMGEAGFVPRGVVNSEGFGGAVVYRNFIEDPVVTGWGFGTCPKCRGKKNMILPLGDASQIVRCHVCGGRGTVPFEGIDLKEKKAGEEIKRLLHNSTQGRLFE